MTRKNYTIRAYGALDVRVSATSLKAAIHRVNRMFDKENPVDPISGRQISTNMMAVGFYVFLPQDTKEFRHVDDPNVPG